jgi:hypothetical protein
MFHHSVQLLVATAPKSQSSPKRDLQEENNAQMSLWSDPRS